jgi:MFS family permease
MRVVSFQRSNALLPVSIATGLSLLGDSALYTLLPTRSEEAGVTLASIGILLSVNRIIRVFLNGPIGVLADRWSRRAIFIPAVFLGAATTGIYALSQDFWGLFIGRLLWGVAWSGIWVSGNAIVLDISDDRSRGKSVGVYQVAFFLGAASGAFLGGILTDWLGYRPAMVVASLISLVGAVIALFFLPETKRRFSRKSIESEDSRLTNNPDNNKTQLASVTLWYTVNRLVMPGVLVATFGLLLSEHIGQGFRLSNSVIGVATLTGVGLGLTTLISMAAAPLAGRLSDRFKNRWRVGAAGLASGAMGFLSLSFGLPMSILMGLPLTSYSNGSNQGLSMAVLGDISFSSIYGKRLGFLFTAGDLGSAVGPLAAYALIPLIGISALYRLCAGLLAVMFLVAMYWAYHRESGS